ncbi:hypothetical protein LA66_00530 [Aureimonas altamirensis]|uniref:Uncharacterized protein n=1 Tax=Aureimonas altamirensis TaxID=370622 RepID=A0A0B1Q2Y4_9HYPH|nr:hypothetical protein LA66_00530 [Aureimonas altamirensis]
MLGAVWYGFSTDVLVRVWTNIADRPGGPMTFRFILQPCVAGGMAIIDGIKDARLGRSPYLWTIVTNQQERAGRLREGLIATARIILLGLGMDTIYQATVLRTFYPGEMAIIVLLLAFVPYLLLRGPFARIARWWLSRKSAGSVS